MEQLLKLFHYALLCGSLR